LYSDEFNPLQVLIFRKNGDWSEIGKNLELKARNIISKSSVKTTVFYTLNPMLDDGQSQSSPQNNYKLVMEANGNLALYRLKDNKLIWESGTTNKGVPQRRLVMRSDGNLAIYDGEKNLLWQSGYTNIGDLKNRLEVTDDGYVILRRPKGEVVWSSKDSTKPSKPSKPEVPAGTIIQTDGNCPENREDDYVAGISYVRIQRNKEPAKMDQYLNFSQLEVFDTKGVNVALKKPTQASSNWSGADQSGLVVDGRAFARSWPDGFCSGSTNNEWWEVDLKGSFDIKRAKFYNRLDWLASHGTRITDFNLQLLDSDRKIIREYTFTKGTEQYCINTV